MTPENKAKIDLTLNENRKEKDAQRAYAFFMKSKISRIPEEQISLKLSKTGLALSLSLKIKKCRCQRKT